MSKDVTSNLNGIFEEEKKKKKKKNTKADKKKKQKEAKKLEKIEDKEFLKMKEEELENSIPELYLTQVDEIPYDKQEKRRKEKKKNEKKKDVSDFFNENDEYTFIQKKTANRMEKTRSLDIPEEKKFHFLSYVYDTIFGFFLIITLLITGAYMGIQIYQHATRKEIMISTSLVLGIFFYVISNVIKKESIKKLFAILSSIFICIFITLTFYWA